MSGPELRERLLSRAEYEDNGGCCDRQMEDVGALLREAAGAISAAPQPAPAVGVKPLGWRHYPDAFPPMWVSQGAAFGNYSIEEAAGSDSPTYDVLNPTMGVMVNCDGLPEAKAAAQADYDTRIRSALTPEGAPT